MNDVFLLMHDTISTKNKLILNNCLNLNRLRNTSGQQVARCYSTGGPCAVPKRILGFGVAAPQDPIHLRGFHEKGLFESTDSRCYYERRIFETMMASSRSSNHVWLKSPDSMILVNRHYDMMYENLDHQYSADMILLRYIKYIKHKPLHILMIKLVNSAVLEQLGGRTFWSIATECQTISPAAVPVSWMDETMALATFLAAPPRCDSSERWQVWAPAPIDMWSWAWQLILGIMRPRM